MMKRFRYLLVFLFFIGIHRVMAADDEPLVFMPQWTAQAQFAGFYVAEAKGFYREAGVKVKIVHPTSTQISMKSLVKNQCHASTTQLCEAMEMIADGASLVNILQT